MKTAEGIKAMKGPAKLKSAVGNTGRRFAAALSALGALTAAAFTVETAVELHLTTDFDGDGRADVIVVDKASGAYRVGYQTVAGKYDWVESRASGIQDVTAVGAGYLISAGPWRDLAFTSPSANRVAVQSGGPLPLPVGLLAVNPLGFGPSQLAVLDIPGLGTSPFEDMVATTVFGPPNAPFALNRIRNLGGGAFASLPLVTLGSELAHLQTVQLSGTDPLRLGGLFRGGSKDTFTVWSSTNPPSSPLATATVAADGDFAYGRFNGSHDRHHFLFYRAGRTDFISVPVNLTSSNTLTLGAGVTLDLGRRVANFVVVPTLPNRLLVSFNDAQEAVVYAFDGKNPPTEIQKVQPPAGQLVTGAVATPDGSFFVYAGAPAATASTSFRQYALNGAKHDLVAEGSLPLLNAQAVNANLFLFAGEPFVAAKPVLVQTLNAADWASKPDVSGATIKVMAEKFGTSAQGLDNPAARDFGPKPATVTHALANQYVPPISVASMQPAVGNTVVDFAIAPLPGPQHAAVNVMITALTPAATVFWRTSPTEPWSSAAGNAIFPLYRNSTVEYFGRIGLAKSRIHRAAYQFPDTPPQQDSDADGVPDFVELAKGLNPNGGADSDGDGYTDKDELFAGTNPLDVNLPPTNAPIAKVEENAAFTLLASPRPYDGFTPGEVAPSPLQAVHLHQLDGAFLASEVTAANAGALFNPSARFKDAPADITQSLFALATDSHFDIQSAGPAGPVFGRELLSLFPVPELERPVFVFTPSPGPLDTQADAWIAAAKAAAAAVVKPTVKVRFGTEETLAALLLERKVEQILTSRGHSFPPTNRLSLFSFRPGDVTRQPVTQPKLQALELLGPADEPAWNLVTMLGGIHAALADPAAAKLRQLTDEIYRVSSLSNNVAPGQFPLPVDALRAFFDAGALHSNYLANVTLAPADLAGALTSSQGILIGLMPRPTNSFDLEVTLDSFQPKCTTLKLVGSATTKNLFVARGVPFKFPDSFALLPGSRVRVLAFTDVVDPCPGDDLQVIGAELIAIPAPTLADSDGDFLPDDWECAFLGGVGDNAFQDFDGDGASNLQEYFDGTDPKDNQSQPAVIVNLAPPALTLLQLGGGQLKLTFTFPAQYADKFDFVLQTAADLGGEFGSETLTPVYLGNGQFELSLVGDAPVKFFLLQQLKPAGESGHFLVQQPPRR